MNFSNYIIFITTFPVIILLGILYYKKNWSAHEEVYIEIIRLITFNKIKVKTAKKIFLMQNVLIALVAICAYVYSIYKII